MKVRAIIEMSRYLIVIAETGTRYSAYSPDLPGCIATGKTRDNVEREMHDAIEFHLDGLRRAGEPIRGPAPKHRTARSAPDSKSVGALKHYG